MIKILTLSGSLRRSSSNTALLHAAASLSPQEAEMVLFDNLGNLPLFNPDLEGIEPSSVIEFRTQLKNADGVMIASPEYAHGVPGAIKNALDWTVSSGEFIEKPVALLNASPRARHAHAALAEIITTMMGSLVTEASLTVPLPHNKINKEEILKNPELCHILSNSIAALINAIADRRARLTIHAEAVRV